MLKSLHNHSIYSEGDFLFFVHSSTLYIFEVPPEAVEAGHVSKRHEEADAHRTLTKKMMRCSHILAVLKV